MWEFDSWGVDLPAALRLLAELVGGASITPGVNCKGAFCTPSRPQLPAGGRGGGETFASRGRPCPRSHANLSDWRPGAPSIASCLQAG